MRGTYIGAPGHPLPGREPQPALRPVDQLSGAALALRFSPGRPRPLRPDAVRRCRAWDRKTPGRSRKIFRDLTDDDKRGIIAAYYTSVAFLDRNVGRVLDALHRLGLDDNTFVIYMADHGYDLGQHGRFEKHCGYDPALRVPLAHALSRPDPRRRGPRPYRARGRARDHRRSDGPRPAARACTAAACVRIWKAAPSTGRATTSSASTWKTRRRTSRPPEWKFIFCSGRRARHGRLSSPTTPRPAATAGCTI